jgi:uncharacterized protein YmfQ (DUF2313 family)
VFLSAVAASQDDSTSFSFATPSVQLGDVLLVICGFTVLGPVHIVTPSWIEAISFQGALDLDYILLASHVIDGSEGSTMSVTFDRAVTSSPLVECLAYRGIQPPGLSYRFELAGVEGSTSFPCPAQAPRSDQDLYLGIVHDPDNGQPFTLPGTTRYLDGPADSTLGVFELAAAASSGIETATASVATVGTAMSLLLRASDDPQPYSDMLSQLLPPGKLWRLIGSSVLGKLLTACADELGRLEGRVQDLLVELDPSTASELIPDYERELDIVAAPTIAERRARIIAKTIQNQGARPDDFRQELSSLLGQAAADVVVIERTRAQAIALGDDREIYAFFIYRDPTLPGVYFLTAAQEHVTAMQPGHTIGTVIESINALYDDPLTLHDRDILGA